MSKLPEIVESFENKWSENLPAEDYHADKTFVSSTALRKILKSPHSFYTAHIDIDHEETQAMRFGTAFHLALLEPKQFFSRYVKLPEFKGTGSKAAKQEWLDSQAKDAVIVTEEEFLKLEGMVNSVLKHRDASALLRNGSPEVSGFYRDPVTGIKCKMRMDLMHWELSSLVDIKTCQDCTYDNFMKHIWSYRYDFQMAMYSAGFEAITGRKTHYHVFFAIEKLPPYEVALYVADEAMMQKGRDDYRIALDQLKECLQSNHWPAYQSSLREISLPRWAFGPLNLP